MSLKKKKQIKKIDGDVYAVEKEDVDEVKEIQKTCKPTFLC